MAAPRPPPPRGYHYERRDGRPMLVPNDDHRPTVLGMPVVETEFPPGTDALLVSTVAGPDGQKHLSAVAVRNVDRHRDHSMSWPGRCNAPEPGLGYPCAHEPGHLERGIPHATISGRQWWPTEVHRDCETCAEADRLIRRFGIGAWLLAAVLTLWPARHLADEGWTRQDTALEVTFAAVTVVDWMQTITFTQHRYGIPDFNPFLGTYPSRARVNLLIPAGILAHAGISLLLPSGPVRTTWQAVTVVVQIGNVTRTASMGIGLTLPWD